MSEGDFADAAPAFERLAEQAAALGLPRAGLLYLQAGRAQLGLGEEDAAEARFRTGKELLGQLGEVRRAAVLARLHEELLNLGHEALSERLLGSSQGVKSAQDRPAQPPSLPAKCAYCGATVRPDEVERLDGQTYACAYCGSVLEPGGQAAP